ncbi:MAG: hypothetical protein WC389_08005 [Lutibacter sp.]|jgi:hypothetical protein
METDYEKQAENFLTATGTKFKAVYLDWRPYFPDDKQSRAIFKITLRRGRKSYTFTFGQSIAGKTQTPSACSVLACLEKCDAGSFDDFCDNFGYSKDSRKAEKIYKACCLQHRRLCDLYTEAELQKMAEIQ